MVDRYYKNDDKVYSGEAEDDASEALRREQEAGAPGDDQHACVVVWMT